MNILKLQHVSKIYQLKNKKEFYALKDVSVEFSNAGLTCIVGKSGSGKSTLLNLIAMLDTPSKGDIIYREKNYSSFKRKNKPSFYQNEIGIVFQNFNLINDKTVLYNVELPLLIKGIKKDKARELATRALLRVGFVEDELNKKANELSGGQQQRVGIARAIVTKPKILLCDEPTGHLDVANSVKVMEILRSLSKERLVILVSHNLPLVREYADRIITLKDGEIIEDALYKDRNSKPDEDEPLSKNKSSWINNVFLSNYRKRLKRNIFTSICLVISFVMFNLVMGFSNGKDAAIRKTCYQQFNYGVGTIAKEEKVSGTGMLSLTKSVRPNLEELNRNENITKIFEICPNFSTILYQNLIIEYDGQSINDLEYKPIYSFKNNYIDQSLLADGYIPDNDSLNEVVINQFARDYIKSKIGKDPVGEYITLNGTFTNNYITENEEYITDTFYLNKQIRIVGVVKELKYLASNKIYFSHVALEDLFHTTLMPNLSTYNDTDITWYDYVMNSSDVSMITSYSYNVFLKDISYKDIVSDPSFKLGDKLNYTSESILLTSSLKDFVDVAQYGVILFTIISSIGSVLILGIMSFVSYSEDRKISAIFTFLGARNGDILDIYLGESIINGLASFLISICVSLGLEKLINLIIHKSIEMNNLISIPFLSFLGIKFLFPIVFLLSVILVVVLATSIPIGFSKFNKVMEELQSL